MNKELTNVFERARGWPEEAQDKLARAACDIETWLNGDYHATVDELRVIDDAQQSRAAPDREVKAAFRSFRRP